MHDALVAPRPVQPRLPILIGGSGPQKTLRTTARYADAWNAGGSLEDLRKKDAILRERCAEVGRNPDEIERTTSVWMTIRDDPHEARQVLAANAAANGDSLSDDDVAYVGTPEQIADRLRPIVELGFEHVIVDLMAPYDAETLERLPDVRERLAR
jgi:alkanesulfonate monooxygenase SsuD/methylene tetrahydromethanopterin reductase-like flavin-dependent oxidoreductase (luciferase family)